MNLIHAIAMLFITLFPTSVFAEGPANDNAPAIDGAFGLNFGDTLEPKGDGILNIMGYRTTAYETGTASNLFKNFFAAVAPTSKTVAAIGAISDGLEVEQSCRESARLLARFLTLPLGRQLENFVIIDPNLVGDMYAWRRGDVDVQLACRIYGAAQLYYVQIFYTDASLMEEFKAENLTLNFGIASADGLGPRNSTAMDDDVAKGGVASPESNLNGPLGFVWGSGLDAAPGSAWSEIDLTRQQSISSERMQYFCQSGIISDMGGALLGYSYATVLGVEDATGLSKPYLLNEIDGDVSILGRVSARLFYVEFAGTVVNVCAAFFDNQLFMLRFYYDDLAKKNVYDLFAAALMKQYGDVRPACFFGACSRSWVDAEKQVTITDVVTHHITYFYAPVKGAQLSAWVEYYDRRHLEIIGGAKL